MALWNYFLCMGKFTYFYFSHKSKGNKAAFFQQNFIGGVVILLGAWLGFGGGVCFFQFWFFFWGGCGGGGVDCCITVTTVESCSDSNELYIGTSRL